MKGFWESFCIEKLKLIFEEKNNVLDIGGGLRILKNRGNIYSKNNEWILKYLENIDYKIMDPFDTYNPDIIGDIHDMPFKDNTLEAIICSSVLEHVENPIKASEELYRVLKPGGYCYVYVPFLYYYHDFPGYFGDFWRFTENALRYMFREFKVFEIQKSRGAIETLLHLSSFGRSKLLIQISRFFDKIFKKQNSKQTSGFYVFLVK